MSDYEGFGLGTASEIAYQRKKAVMKKEAAKTALINARPNVDQTTLKEFEEGGNKMSYNNPVTGNLRPMKESQLNEAIRNFPVQGNNMATRGTQLSHAPTSPTMNHPLVAPTGGVTPVGNDKGPEKQVKDNVMNKDKREVQRDFNTGPNKGMQEKVKLQVYKSDKGFLGNMISKVGSFFGLEHEKSIGMGIETSDLFGKPVVETQCSDSGKAKFVSAEKKK